MKNPIFGKIQKFRKNQFFVSVFKVGSGQFIAQAMSLLSVPILSRIYSDLSYGDTAIITSTASILINVAALGLTSAIMKPEDDDEAKIVFTTAAAVNFIIVTVFVLICALLGHKIELFSVSGSYGLALVIMWMYATLYSMSLLLGVYANRKKQYDRLFMNPIIGSITNFVIAIPLGLLGFGYEGFMITNIIQYLCICVHMMWGNNPFASHYRFRDFRYVICTYKEYILFQYPSNFIENFGIEYPTQYLGRVFTAQQLGGYSLCARVMQYPIRLIAAPISTVYFRTATEYQRQGKNLAEFTFKMIRGVLLISAVPVALFILTSEWLFAFAFGRTWREAGTLAGFLVVQYVLLFCSQTVSYCRVSIGKQKVNLGVSVVRLVVTAVSCTAGYALFGDMEPTVLCFSLGQCAYNIYDMAINFYCMSANKRCLWKYLAISVPYALVMLLLSLAKRYIIC